MTNTSKVEIKSVLIEVFQHATESNKLILSGIRNLFPFLDEDQIPNSSSKSLLGYHKNQIIHHGVLVKKKGITNPFLMNLINNLMDNPTEIDFLNKNISENGEIHLRIDKQMLISKSKIILVHQALQNNTGVYKITIKLLYYGKKTEKLNKITSFIESFSKIKF